MAKGHWCIKIEHKCRNANADGKCRLKECIGGKKPSDDLKKEGQRNV